MVVFTRSARSDVDMPNLADLAASGVPGAAALFTATSASLLGSFPPRDDGGSVPLASISVPLASFPTKYVAKLRPTKLGKSIVGDKGARGKFIIKGYRSGADSYVKILGMYWNLKSKGGVPYESQLNRNNGGAETGWGCGGGKTAVLPIALLPCHPPIPSPASLLPSHHLPPSSHPITCLPPPIPSPASLLPFPSTHPLYLTPHPAPPPPLPSLTYTTGTLHSG
ncbi:unnamed protein product [Closterium sp. Naga37s-1]|nr:unnamed protein product [Closterium sp. Naga37s-1]